MCVELACFIVLLILRHILNGDTALIVVYKYVSFGALHSNCKHEHFFLLPPPCHCDVLPRRLVFCQLFSVLTFSKFVDFQTSSLLAFSEVQVDAQQCSSSVRSAWSLECFNNDALFLVFGKRNVGRIIFLNSK